MNDFCVFVDIFNVMAGRGQKEGSVLEVTSRISSFRLCCIITSSAVINSDVPTGMRPCALRCSPHFLLGQCLQSDPSLCHFKEQWRF